MTAVAIPINSTSWTQITSAGQSAICWVIKNPAFDRVLVDHSSTGTGSLSASKSYSLSRNKEVIRELMPDGSSDIFYARCNRAGTSAVVVIDDNIGATSNAISDQNSTSTPLSAGGYWAGEWIDITSYGIIYVNVYSDVSSAIDGLVVQQSSDGVFADHTDEFTVPALKGKNYSINPHAKYLRVVYYNGTSDQTQFRLQTKLNCTGLASSHRIKDDITTDDDARIVKSVLMTKANDQNEYKNVELNNPIPVNGGQLYPHDINLEHSNQYNFSGTAIDLLDDRWTPIVDSTATNPKLLLMEYERPMQTPLIGLVTEVGDFSNVVIKFGISDSPWYTLYDGSADSTKRTVLVAPSVPITLNKILLEFHTADTVTLTGFNLAKSTSSISQLQGIDPAGELRTIGSTYTDNLTVSIQEYGDTASIDPFDRLRVGEPFTIFDSKQLYDKQPLFYDERLGGSATSVHSTTDARVRLTVTASSSDYGIRQTKQRFNYQPGKGELVFFTSLTTQESGVIKRCGIFDGIGTNYMTPNNGIFFSVSGTEIRWNIAKNGSTTESIEQADWNYDKLDGSGPSRIVFNDQGTHIGVIDFEWLGVGRVRVGFVIDGILRYVHYFTHSNSSSFNSVYMSTPNLPIRYDIQSDGTGGGSIDHICSTVISEGGIEETGISRSVDTGSVHLDANAADTPYVLIAIRLKTTHLDLTVLPEYISMISETNDDFRWALMLNPTYNGTLTWIDIPNSGCQYALGTTANDITAEGTKFDSGYSKSASSIDRRIKTSLRIGSNIDLTRDILVYSAMPLASNADLQGSMTFRELL